MFTFLACYVAKTHTAMLRLRLMVIRTAAANRRLAYALYPRVNTITARGRTTTLTRKRV